MKTLLVTGSTGNLGQAVVKRFLEGGFDVTGTRIPGDESQVIDHPSFNSLTVDLDKEDEAAKMVDRLVNAKDSLDVAVLTVGGFAMGGIAKTGAADIMRQFELNFLTAYHVARPVFLQMQKQGSGKIFFVGSRPGSDMHAGKGMVSYALAKSLVFRLSELLNDEAKGTDVVSTVIVPSTIDTPQNRRSMPDADPQKWVKADDIAEVIWFYASAAAAAIREPVIKLYNKA